MHESPDEIGSLQEMIENSYRKAGSHLLSIHKPEWRLNAIQVAETLTGVCVLNLATVNSKGEPIIAPVDGLFLGGIFWFGSSEDSVRFKHIRSNPNVSAAYTQGEEISILVHGAAHEINTASGSYERFHNYCREIYGSEYDSWGYWGNAPFAWIEAKRFYAIKIQHGPRA